VLIFVLKKRNKNCVIRQLSLIKEVQNKVRMSDRREIWSFSKMRDSFCFDSAACRYVLWQVCACMVFDFGQKLFCFRRVQYKLYQNSDRALKKFLASPFEWDSCCLQQNLWKTFFAVRYVGVLAPRLECIWKATVVTILIPTNLLISHHASTFWI